jgi:hypothetical protein
MGEEDGAGLFVRAEEGFDGKPESPGALSPSMVRLRTESSMEPNSQLRTRQAAWSQAGSVGRAAMELSMCERSLNLPHMDLKKDAHLV